MAQVERNGIMGELTELRAGENVWKPNTVANKSIKELLNELPVIDTDTEFDALAELEPGRTKEGNMMGKPDGMVFVKKTEI